LPAPPGSTLAAGRTFAHDEKGLRALCRTLVRLKVQLVTIERPDGLLLERLLDAGLRVLAMHPNRVVASRARFRVSGSKSDRFDAFVLCELARTDSDRFRVLEPDGDQTKALRALTRGREDLVHARVALTNQLRAELERFWPGPIGLFQKLDSPRLILRPPRSLGCWWNPPPEPLARHGRHHPGSGWRRDRTQVAA
jgi:transposase